MTKRKSSITPFGTSSKKKFSADNFSLDNKNSSSKKTPTDIRKKNYPFHSTIIDLNVILDSDEATN